MYRKEILTYCVSILLVLAAALLHLLDAFHQIHFSVHVIIFCLYTLLIFLWKRNMENRMLRVTSRRHFRTISFLLVGYLALRTLKYEILFDNPYAMQHIRYGYYFFSLNIVHLVFFTSLLISQSERQPIHKLWNLLWIPTESFVLLILTNDYHGLAFSLTGQRIYQYGPVFYMVLGYTTLLAAGTLVFTLIPCFTTKNVKPILLPIFFFVLWILYTFFYIFDVDWRPFYYFKLMIPSSEFNILIVILFIESLVFTRLLPSNRGYDRFLKMSALKIGIMNSEGEIIVQPTNGPEVTSDLIKRALLHPVPLDQDTLLESASIQGGTSFWFVDLTNFHALKARLLALNEDLMNENDLLLADNKLKEKIVKIEEQERIRSYIAAKLEPQFRRLKEIIDHIPDEEEAFEATLKDACIYSVYIKRYANLFLLSKTKARLALAEVSLAFSESLDHLRLRGIRTSLHWQIKDTVDAPVCLRMYEIFQAIIELHVPFLSSLSVDLEKQGKILTLIIHIESSKLFSLKTAGEELKEPAGLSLDEHLTNRNPYWRISVEGGLS